MISRIFNKTKPTNFIIITVYLLCYTLISTYFLPDAAPSFYTVALNLWIFALLVSTVFLMGFINKKSKLSENNAYAVVLFALCVSFFPQLFTAEHLIWAHIFVLLGLGSLLRLKDGTAIKQKIFEAAFWICIATLFYSWALLYFIIIYLAIILYAPGSYKNWVIPFIAVLAAAILRYTYFLWFEDATALFRNFQFKIQLQQINQSPAYYSLPFIFLTAISVISIFAYSINTVKKRIRRQFSAFLMVIALLLGIGMVLFCGGDEKEASILFMFFPLAILFTNYLERIKKKWIKESFFWLFLLMPAVVLFLRFGAVNS